MNDLSLDLQKKMTLYSFINFKPIFKEHYLLHIGINRK